MAELLEVYDLADQFVGVEEREAYYEKIRRQFASTGQIDSQVKTVRLMMMNSDGRIYLQKRSSRKSENPGLYDKTVGGHVPRGYSYDLAAVKECAEELGTPSAIVVPEEFREAIRSVDLSIIGVFRRVGYVPNFMSVREIREGGQFVQPTLCTFYVGYYNGAIRFADGESSGIEVLSLEELAQELEFNPRKFTEDVRYMVKEYQEFYRPIK